MGEPKSSSWNPTNFFGKQQIGSEKLTSGNLTKKQWRKCKSVVDRCCLRPPLFHNLRWEDQRKTCCLPWDNWGHAQTPEFWVIGQVTKGVAPSCGDRLGTWPNKELRDNYESAADMLFLKVWTVFFDRKWALFLQAWGANSSCTPGKRGLCQVTFSFLILRPISTQVGTSDIRMGANPFQSGSGVEGSIKIWRRMSKRWLQNTGHHT